VKAFPGVVHVGCFAHARRKFFEASAVTKKPGKAEEGLSRIGKAVFYTLGQWDKLIRYLDSPYLTPDNNVCENTIRPFVLGRKNWLFSGSPRGAESSCGLYSLIETAKRNGQNPYWYLAYVFEQVPLITSRDKWETLLPWNVRIPSKP